jgi:23S rRNA pseudouridine1911/1915/1917 synthase
LLNGRPCRKGRAVRSGDSVELLEAPSSARFNPLPDPDCLLPVCFEDEHIVVVDKPAGVPTCPLRPEERRTAAGALLARFPEMKGVSPDPREAGLVQRLDTGTSGLLLAARHARAFQQLRRLLRSGQIDKRYLALCAGRVPAPADLRSWLGSRRRASRRVRVQDRPGRRAREALTEILGSKPVGDFSLVYLRVFSGRRHQIRAQMSAIGHPLAGDALYGGPPVAGLDRHFLHASELRFVHPVTGRPLRVRSDLPPELGRVLASLRAQGRPGRPRRTSTSGRKR